MIAGIPYFRFCHMIILQRFYFVRDCSAHQTYGRLGNGIIDFRYRFDLRLKLNRPGLGTISFNKNDSARFQNIILKVVLY